MFLYRYEVGWECVVSSRGRLLLLVLPGSPMRNCCRFILPLFQTSTWAHTLSISVDDKSNLSSAMHNSPNCSLEMVLESLAIFSNIVS